MTRRRTMLADFHVHTTFSDGKMPLPEVIDLYGKRGFGAIAITDHIAEEKTLIGKIAILIDQVLTPDKFTKYMELLEAESERAWAQYRMVVIPGFELSKNSISNHRSAHILGIGVSNFISADGDVKDLALRIREQGALAIAAHPVSSFKLEKQTLHLWNRREELSNVFDAWEVSGTRFFDEVAETRLPKVASSDLHVSSQLNSWKTVLHCEPRREAILDAIRKQDVKFVYYDAKS